MSRECAQGKVSYRLLSGRAGGPHMPEVIQQRQIQTTLEQITDAFTTARGWREWFCDDAYSRPVPKGRYWLRWKDGYRVDGSYLEVTPARIALVWRAADAPAESHVTVSLQASAGNVQVQVRHVIEGTTDEATRFLQRCSRRWEHGLTNLESVLETGIDLRQAQRACLGIRWSLAEGGGIHVLEVLEGSGGDMRQVQRGDVILAIDDEFVDGYAALVSALEAYSPGDQVTLMILRQGVQESVDVVLGALPRSERMRDARSLLAGMRNRQIEMQRLLSDTLRGTTEAEASRRPAPDEWSVKEILAHLSLYERHLHYRLYQMIMYGWDNSPKGNPAILPEALAAAMSRTDTLPRLLDRFAQDQAETLALFASLRPSLVAHKGLYRRLLETLDVSEHTSEHIAQIAATLQRIRAQRDATP